MVVHKEARDFSAITHHMVATIAYYHCVVSIYYCQLLFIFYIFFLLEKWRISINCSCTTNK